MTPEALALLLLAAAALVLMALYGWSLWCEPYELPDVVGEPGAGVEVVAVGWDPRPYGERPARAYDWSKEEGL